jgi:DNA-binding NtrC family response regulator
VDDEVNALAAFQRVLSKAGYDVTVASSGEEALRRLEAEWFDLVISDLKLPGLDGLALLRRVKTLNPTLPVILLTGYGTIASAVGAMKEGAYDYLSKPINNEELKVVVKKALDLHRLTREVEHLRAQVEIDKHIIGRSKPMKALFRLIKLVAPSSTTVLIQGESGTGKELIARAIHQLSPRRDRPFVAIDCGALPETLLESELFGYVRGAFTGAVLNKKGLFCEAQGGTLLLDEIGDTTPAFQAKLLRVLQEREIRPLGSNRIIKVDVRVIAATSKDLKKAVAKGTFREDLYYRLAVMPILVPPLRQRREDMPLLIDHFIQKYCAQNRLEPKRISAKALKVLIDYPWPGNVRELENVIERAVLLSPGAEIHPKALFLDGTGGEEFPQSLAQATEAMRATVEQTKIREAIRLAQGNRSQAAKLLCISRATLYNKLKRYGLSD